MQGGVSLRENLEELYILEAKYSQPSDFFKIPARKNIEFITAKGIDDLRKYNQDIVFGLSQEVLFLTLDKIYSGFGLGAYIKVAATDRISSKFTFGQRVFIGYRANDRINLEMFVNHFSNGTLTSLNSGQNFVGLSLHSYF